MARVLVADDEAAMRDVITMALQLEGHEPHESYDTPSTLAAYFEIQPELLILDLAMPGGGGLEVLRHLASTGSAMCPVIIVSGYVAEVAADMRPLLAKHRVIEKPFALETLRQAIREALLPPV